MLFAASFVVACNSTDQPETTEVVSEEQHAAHEALADTKDYTEIEWLDSVKQDLGTVKEGQVVEVTYRFKNSGDKPLVIANAQPSCGCTVAEKPEKPIMPGDEGLIRAKFDSKNRVGPNHKDINVTMNTRPQNTERLQFTVVVKGDGE